MSCESSLDLLYFIYLFSSNYFGVHARDHSGERSVALESTVLRVDGEGSCLHVRALVFEFLRFHDSDCRTV